MAKETDQAETLTEFRVRLTPEQARRLEELRDATGVQTSADVIRVALCVYDELVKMNEKRQDLYQIQFREGGVVIATKVKFV